MRAVARQLAALAFGALALASPALPQHRHEAGASHSGDAMQKRWEARLAEGGGMAVSLAQDDQGRLWRVRAEGGYLWVDRSDDGGLHFAPGVKVNTAREAILAEGENRPRITVGKGSISVAWARALPKVFAGHIRYSRSTDNGLSFSPPLDIDDDSADIGHSFVAMNLSATGRLTLVWLDSRERQAQGKAYRGSSVFYAVSNDGGAHFAKNEKLADHSCECCRIALAEDSAGKLHALWRQVFADGSRDFALGRIDDRDPLTRATEDHWQIEACPHHGGDLAIAQDGRTHLVWFTGSESAPGLHYRHRDGDRFSPPLNFGKADAQAGHAVVFADRQAVFLAWREFDGERFRVLAMHSGDRGDHWSRPREVAASAGAADVPIFVVGAKRPLLAWNTEHGLRVIDLAKP